MFVIKACTYEKSLVHKELNNDTLNISILYLINQHTLNNKAQLTSRTHTGSILWRRVPCMVMYLLCCVPPQKSIRRYALKNKLILINYQISIFMSATHITMHLVLKNIGVKMFQKCLSPCFKLSRKCCLRTGSEHCLMNIHKLEFKDVFPVSEITLMRLNVSNLIFQKQKTLLAKKTFTIF